MVQIPNLREKKRITTNSSDHKNILQKNLYASKLKNLNKRKNSKENNSILPKFIQGKKQIKNYLISQISKSLISKFFETFKEEINYSFINSIRI